jgi:hypothetical protein
MSQYGIELASPDGVMAIIVGETIPEQTITYRKLSAAEFGEPLLEQDYLEQERCLGQKLLVQGRRWRLWFLLLANDPGEVLATCKTIPIDLLIWDVMSTSRQKAYRIIGSVTNS